MKLNTDNNNRILILNGTIWDGNSFFISDILICDGVISKIEKDLNENADFCFDAENMIVSAGLTDFHTHIKGISPEHIGIDYEKISYPFGVTHLLDASAEIGDINNILNSNIDISVLAVYVNTEEFEGWWYQGGGIYRNVYLTVTEPVCIDLWGVYAPYEKKDDGTWIINYETAVLNTGYEDCDVTAESNLLDKDGNNIASASRTGFAEKKIRQLLGIPQLLKIRCYGIARIRIYTQ